MEPNLRFSAKILLFLRKSAVFCGFLRPPNAGISRRQGESAKICGFLRKPAFWVISVTLVPSPWERPEKVLYGHWQSQGEDVNTSSPWGSWQHLSRCCQHHPRIKPPSLGLWYWSKNRTGENRAGEPRPSTRGPSVDTFVGCLNRVIALRAVEMYQTNGGPKQLFGRDVLREVFLPPHSPPPPKGVVWQIKQFAPPNVWTISLEKVNRGVSQTRVFPTIKKWWGRPWLCPGLFRECSW